jgi:hypothetical protein
MAFFAKRSEAPDRISSKHSIDGDPSDPYPQLDPIEPVAAPESGMSPLVARVLGMLGFDPHQLELMSVQIAAVVKDAEQRLTRIEGKLDELLSERRAVHAALQAQKNGKDDDLRA